MVGPRRGSPDMCSGPTCSMQMVGLGWVKMDMSPAPTTSVKVVGPGWVSVEVYPS